MEFKGGWLLNNEMYTVVERLSCFVRRIVSKSNIYEVLEEYIDVWVIYI